MTDNLILLRRAWRRINRGRWERRFFRHKQATKLRHSEEYRTGRKVSRIDLSRSLKLLEPSNQKPFPELEYVGLGGDGSYMIPVLKKGRGIDVLISPGVGQETHFDELMAQRGASVVLLDGTLDAPPPMHENFIFIPQNIGLADDEVTLDSVLEDQTDHELRIAMQLDIEGAEYEALSKASISDFNLGRFSWLVVEFHNLHRLGIEGEERDQMNEVISRLNRHFLPVHLNVNNAALPIQMFDLEVPGVVEVTYVNRHELEEFVLRDQPAPTVATRNEPRLPLLDWPDLSL